MGFASRSFLAASALAFLAAAAPAAKPKAAAPPAAGPAANPEPTPPKGILGKADPCTIMRVVDGFGAFPGGRNGVHRSLPC